MTLKINRIRAVDELKWNDANVCL